MIRRILRNASLATAAAAAILIGWLIAGCCYQFGYQDGLTDRQGRLDARLAIPIVK